MTELTSLEAYATVRDSKTLLALIGVEQSDKSLWLYTTDGTSAWLMPVTEAKLKAIYGLLKKRYGVHPDAVVRVTHDDKPVNVQFLPSSQSHLEDYARALLAAGHPRELVDDLVIGLMWSSLFFGDEGHARA